MSRQPTGIPNILRCSLSFALIVLPCLPLRADVRLPAAGRFPMDQWLTDGLPSRLRLRVEVATAELTSYQRLMVRVTCHIDGRALGKRRASGEFVSLIQYRDAKGNVWQDHAPVKILNASGEVTVTRYAFVLPGDYSVIAGLTDTISQDHVVSLRRIHVVPLKTDPLPNAWDGLPPVELISYPIEPPDLWYLPESSSRLRLSLKTRRPVHIQVLVNTTPSQRSLGSVSTLRYNMSLLIPAVRILSQLDIPNGSVDVAFLDLTNQRIPFEQKGVGSLEWDRARKYFVDTRPGIIDARSLQGQWKMRTFFFDEVSHRLTPAAGQLPVVIVLSGPAFLEDQEPIEPVTAQSSDCQLFYLRYRSDPVRPARTRPRPGMRPPAPVPALYPMPVDDLERTVEPLGARVFDAGTPEQFRRILAAVLDQISRM